MTAALLSIRVTCVPIRYRAVTIQFRRAARYRAWEWTLVGEWSLVRAIGFTRVGEAAQ